MRTLQRTSQCQRSPCCLLADRELRPIANPGAAVEAPVETAPTATPGVPTPVEAPVQVVPAAPAIDASSEDAVAPAYKKARQYDLQPQQPLQPMPHLQPPLPTSSSSPAALPEPDTTSSPTEPETKKHKQQHEDSGGRR